MNPIVHLTPAQLLKRYDGFLIDAFGVLVDHGGALAGANAFLESLLELDKRWLVVTNDAARTPASAAAWYRSLGLPIVEERVLTSSALLPAWFSTRDLVGSKCIVLGPPDVRAMIARCGVTIVAFDDDTADCLAVCDEAGFPFLEAMDAVTSWWIRRIDSGRPPAAVLANPDFIYPKGGGAYGIAAGSVASMLEGAVRARHPDAPPLFDRLGKPHPPMFDAALARLRVDCDPPLASERIVMLGDTPATDIRGGLDAGIDAVLVTGGVSTDAPTADAAQPTARVTLLTA